MMAELKAETHKGALMYKPSDPRMQAAFLCMNIQENETVMKGRKTFKGNAKLQRIIEYLINTTE